MPAQYSHSNSLPAVVFPLYLGIGDRENDNDDLRSLGRDPTPHEDLPYRVELWDDAKQAVEVVLAVTANSSIGYAAYFAATREYPDRFVTLRHKNRTVAKIVPMGETERAAGGTEMDPSSPTASPDDLPYVIEIWDESHAQNVERVLARAANIKLARAILRSAEQEYPARRITLRTGDRVIEDVRAHAERQGAPQADNAH